MENCIEYKKPAELLKALAHPTRLQIVHGLLTKGRCNVRYLENCTGMSQSCISQHLQRLRSAGVVEAERSGNEVFYRAASHQTAILMAHLMGEEASEYAI